MNAQKTDGRFDVLLRAAYVGYDDKDADYLAAVDTSDVKIPQRVRNRITRKIRVYFKRKNETKSTRVARKTALVLAILVGLTFLLCISVSGIRNRVLGAVLTHYDEYDRYDFGYVDIEGISRDIEKYKKPTWIPFETEEEVVIKTDQLLSITYRSKRSYIMFSQSKQSAGVTVTVTNTHCTITDERINGYTGQLYSYNNGSFELLWVDNEYIYKIFSTVKGVKRKDIIKMAESVE